MEDTKKMMITDENGNEIEVEILFTFESEDTGYSYVIFSQEADPEQYYAYRYDEDGNLDEITEEEMEMCEELLNTFAEENML